MQHQSRARSPISQVLVLALIGTLALAVRIYYVTTAVVDHPLRGDAIQYFSYALNLVDHQVFSLAPLRAQPTPDSFRDPGYPAFLAGVILLMGREQAFYVALLNLQAVLSGVTAIIYMLLARRWIGQRAACAVGIAMAFWPHTITLAGYILSETWLAFLVASFIACVQIAADRRSPGLAMLAGLLGASAALTNAVLIPVLLSAAAFFTWRRPRERTMWLLLALVMATPIAAWHLRSLGLPADATSTDRAMINFVQGSWPEYHSAWVHSVRDGEPDAQAVMDQIDLEYRTMHRDPMAGARAVAGRLGGDPWRYLRWYAQKPIELWGWSIGIGDGDFYVFPTFNSPLSGRGVLRATTDIMFFVQPLALLFAVVGAIMTMLCPRSTPTGLALAIFIILGVTMIFAVLQSDARYSTPYRGIEWVLAVVGVARLLQWLHNRRTGSTRLSLPPASGNRQKHTISGGSNEA